MIAYLLISGICDGKCHRRRGLKRQEDQIFSESSKKNDVPI